MFRPDPFTVSFLSSMLKNTTSLFVLASCLPLIMVFPRVACGQEDIEAIARLHVTFESDSMNWFEGYEANVSGMFSPYSSHRSGTRRDSAFVVRTSGPESMIEWQTSPVPSSWHGDSATFLWACGFGNNLGNGSFSIEADTSIAISFSTPNSASWSLAGKGGRLGFVATTRNSNGANLGYMCLTIPGSGIHAGKPLALRVRGRREATEVWYRLFAYRDALEYFGKREGRNFFSNVELRQFGDAWLSLFGRRSDAGSVVRLLSSGTMAAEDQLRPHGILSRVSIRIPRDMQPLNDQVTSIQVGGSIVDSIRWDGIHRRRLRAFLDEELECDRYVFPPGDFPDIRWKRPGLVENEIGRCPLKLTFYDSDVNPVSRAGKTGRYGVVVEGVLPSGFTIRRFLTLYCSPAEFDDYSPDPVFKFHPLKSYGIAEAQWRTYAQNESRFAFGVMKTLPQHAADAAVFLAGLSEMDTAGGATDTPRLRDRQWWIHARQVLDGSGRAASLSPPKKANATGTSMDQHPASTAPFTPAHLEQIRRVCRAWAAESGVPHVTVVVCKGKVVLHEAFNGKSAEQQIDRDSPQWMASITKLLTGVLMMQFVDQKRVDLDSPVAKYLSELPPTGGRSLTVRDLFTHTSGLEAWAGEWASDWNPALENQVAQVLPYLHVGRGFFYHRAGYAVAGRVMERLTGRTVPSLFQDYLFAPLAMKSAYADNTYGGLYCTAIDLARLGQMLLNRGTCNGYRFFSEASYRQLIPAPLRGLDRQWGIGTSAMGGHGLGAEAFGHSAASGAVFRVDPQHDLIIVSARNRPGSSGRQEEFERLLIEACTAPFRTR